MIEKMSNFGCTLKSKYQLDATGVTDICRYLSDSLLVHKNKDLIFDYSNNVTLNGQQIFDSSQAVANCLSDEYQVQSGDAVCLYCPNHYMQVIALISVWSVGGICLVISEKSTYGEVENILKKTHFKYLICGKDNVLTGKKLVTNYPEIKKLFVIGEQTDETDVTNMTELVNCKNKSRHELNANTSDPVLIELTGGTNDGTRKLAVKTHSNIITAINQMQHKDILADNSEDIVVSVPFDRLFGVLFLINSLTSGSKTVIIEGSFDTNGVTYLECIGKSKVTKLIVCAPDLELLVKNEVNLMYDISSIKEIIHLGVFRDYTLLRQSVDTMFKCHYFRGVYGTTESGIISCLYKSKSFERNCYSVGKLIPDTEVKIIDVMSGDSLPAHRNGEICVRSGQLSAGYFLDNSRECFTTDGFFRTNDYGYYDNDGNLYVECRLSDVVAIEDQMYLPNDLHLLLSTHPNVAEVTVVATFCEYSDSESEDTEAIQYISKMNNTFKIFVVLRAGSEINDLDLINFVNDRVEPIRQIDSGLFVVDMLPRNYLGSIRRSALVNY